MPITSFSKYCLQALDIVENAHSNGNLLYSLDYKQKHSDTLKDPIARILVEHGITTHTDLFEQAPCTNGKINKVMEFRLKPKISASHALKSLLNSGETVIDCGAALMLAHIYACLLALEHKYGEQAGQARFDWLFGSAGHETPTVQRLLFSNNTVLRGTKKFLRDPNNNIAAINPFAFLFDFSPISKRMATMKKPTNQAHYIKQCSVGSMVTVVGNDNYDLKHPCGIDRNFNGIYIGDNELGEPLLRVFGKGRDGLTEALLKQMHVDSYNSARSEDDKALIALKEAYGVQEGVYPEKISITDVHGLEILSNLDIKLEMWEFFINSSAKDVMHELRKFLNIQLKERGKVLPDDTLQLPTPAKVYTYYFAGDLSDEKRSLLFSVGATQTSRINHLLAMQLESTVLDKSMRSKVRVERKAIASSHKRAVGELQFLFPEATVEQESKRFLITAPQNLYSNVERFITKFTHIENQVKKAQQGFRQRKLKMLMSNS